MMRQPKIGFRSWSLAVLLGLVAAQSAIAQRSRDEKLEPGDPAPKLQVETWIGSEEVALTNGKMYVVLFWSTTDPDMNQTLTALSALQATLEQHRVTVIAISDEDDDVVEKYVKRMKERINFPVAVDERSATSNDWVKASKIETFPLAFVVGDNGKITFIGSPYDEDFGDILVRTARHRYDAKLEKEANPKLEAARRARKIKNWKSAVKLYDEVIALDTTIFADVTLEKLEQYLVDMDDPSLAYAYANQLLEQYAGDPQFLIDFAHKLTTDPKISDSNRKLDLALQAARTALEITREEDKGDSLSTLALVHFHRQELDQAINFQKQAWMWAAPAHKPRYKRLLDSYQAAQQQQSAKSSAGTKPSP